MSTILVDNLTGKTSAGSITVTSEGGAATQSLQQGLAKVWGNFNGTTNTVADSLNISSVTDNGTADYTYNINNNHNNANYMLSGSGQSNHSQPYFTHLHFSPAGNTSLLTGSVRCIFPYNSGTGLGDVSSNDAFYALMATHGDLA
jgi:hypothetical protein